MDWKMRITAVIVALAALLGVSRAAAEEAAPAFARLVLELVSNNPELRSLDNQIAAAREAAPAAMAWMDPMIALGAAGVPVDDWRFDKEAMTQKTIGVSQTIPSLTRRAAERDMGLARAQMLEARRAMRLADLVMELKMALIEVEYLARAMDILVGTEAALDGMVGVISAKYASGKVTQADVLQVQVERSMLIERRLELAEMLHHAHFRAAAALGRDSGDTFVPAPPPSIEGRMDGLEALWRGALPRSPRLMMARSKINDAGAAVRMAEGMAGYNLTLTAQYGQRDDGVMERPDLASFMASVSVPLWRASKQDRLIKGARFSERAAHDDLASEELRLRSELAIKLASVRREREAIRLYDTVIIPQGAQTFESSMAAYRLDKLESMAVIGAELGLLKYQLAREEAYRRLQERYAEIDALTGADFNGSEP